jgi:8-oxo-dGTP pyrophosphatase MutT (NUDIX family)
MTGPSPWTTLDSRRLVEDRWISLRADTLRTDRGAVLAPWYVLEYPDWTSVVALTDDDRLVLVRQWRHAAGTWCLELPGGIMDPTDADPVAAGTRELLEETGYAPGAARLVHGAFANPALQTNRIHTVLATGCTEVAPVAHEAGESMRVELMPVAEVLGGIAQGILPHGLHVGAALVGLAAAGRINL